MTEETQNTNSDIIHEINDLEDKILPLRDRIVKIETVIDYHDKEFDNVKNCISELADTMDKQHETLLEKLEQHNKNMMDVTYSQYRDANKSHNELRESIQDNKNTFDSFVAKWKAISWAVWFTISVTLGAVGWGLSAAKDLGLFEAVKTTVEIQKQQDS